MGLFDSKGKKLSDKASKLRSAGRFEEAAALSAQAAELGDQSGMWYLGNYYESGSYGYPRDGAKAVYWLTKALEAGQTDAFYRLSEIYQKGELVEQDYPKARQYLESLEALDKNPLDFKDYITVAYRFEYAKGLAKIYAEGLGLEKDSFRADKYYRLALRSSSGGYHATDDVYNEFYHMIYQQAGADGNMPLEEAERADGLAVYWCVRGVKFRAGVNVACDYDKARPYLEKAAELGHPIAQFQLGTMYKNGEGGKISYAAARGMYEKAVEQGVGRAATALGGMYVQGKGGDEDYAAAVKYYKIAAELGHPPGMYMLSTFYRDGLGGLAKWDYMAESLLKDAAERGWFAAERDWGIKQLRSEDEAERKEGVRYLTLAAAKEGEREAQRELARAYSMGIGAKRDVRAAVKWFEKSQKASLSDAQLAYMQLKTELEEETLMVLLDEGHTILESYLPEANPLWSINLWNMFRELKRKEQATEAAAIMELLAERGDKVAQYNTGRHYRLGDGVPQNTARMLFWYELAAAGGLAGAQNNLAVCYNNGDGVRRDKEEAARWWTKAAEQGNVQAQYNLGAYFHDKGCMPAARSWLEKAADQGYKEAAEALRIMRKNGD